MVPIAGMAWMAARLATAALLTGDTQEHNYGPLRHFQYLYRDLHDTRNSGSGRPGRKV